MERLAVRKLTKGRLTPDSHKAGDPAPQLGASTCALALHPRGEAQERQSEHNRLNMNGPILSTCSQSRRGSSASFSPRTRSWPLPSAGRPTTSTSPARTKCRT